MTYGAFHRNLAAVALDDGQDDGKAQAAAAGGSGAGLVHPVEPFEDVADGLFRDAHAGIADL